MLKHCHNSSIRLQRRCHGGLIINPDTVSLNSTVTVHSSCGSSESNTSDSLNSSFQIISDDQCFNVANNNLYQRNSYESPDQPVSLSSRASSYVSLADPGPKTTIKVFASCLRPDIEYKTLSIGNMTTSKSVIWQLLSKYKMKHRDPKLFFLTLEVVIQKPGRDGLTKKTLVLDDDSKPAELKNCNPWGECRFVLQMKKGGVVKVHDSVLMAESQYKCLFISEETTVEEVIKILLHCYGLEKVEAAERYSMYEECRTQRYHRKLHSEERPLAIQALWHGPTQFSFKLSRAVPAVSEAVWSVQGQHRAVAVQVSDKINAVNEGRRVIGSKPTEGPQSQSKSKSWAHRSPDWTFRAASVESGTSSSGSTSSASSGSDYERVQSETESWPECDKDTEEHISGADTDMDTSLSSNDSPIPPGPSNLVTSTPLSNQTSTSRQRGTNNNMPKPAMSFLFPSPDYASFPNSFVPSRPYSAMSGSTVSLGSSNKISVTVPPSLPPKPSSLLTVAPSPKSQSAGSFHDYENYFFI